jgi:hypothetical protein
MQNVLQKDSPSLQKQAKLAATGCVNTSMGAIMYAQAYPKANVLELSGEKIDTEKVFSVTEKFFAKNWDQYHEGETVKMSYPLKRKMKGGSDERHFYDWELMRQKPEDVPLANVPDIQRDEVAALLHDIGAAMNSTYKLFDPDKYPSDFVTDAQIYDVPAIIKKFFYYKDAQFYGSSNIATSAGTWGSLFGLIPTYIIGYLSQKELENVINPSLDLGMPVIIDLGKGDFAKHAVIIDGYGYINESCPTKFGTYKKVVYHVVLNEADTDDGWYDLLPHVQKLQLSERNRIVGIAYNISSADQGGIVGGRVFTKQRNGTLLPLSGASGDLQIRILISLKLYIGIWLDTKSGQDFRLQFC